MPNPKDHRQPARERLQADDLELPAQVRERSQRPAASYRSAPERSSKGAPPEARPARPRPAPPLLPPETNRTQVAQPKGMASAAYSGSVMGEAIQRSQTGRLGQPQPPPPPVRPAATERPLASDSPPAPKQRRAEQRPVPERLERILDTAVEGVAAPRPSVVHGTQPVRDGSRPALRQDWIETVYIPVAGPNQMLLVCVAISVALLWALFYTPLGASLGTYTGPNTLSDWVSQALGTSPAAKQLSEQPVHEPMLAPVGETTLVGPPTISAAQIDAILASYGSPAVGTGRDFYDLGVKYGIDPAFAVAFFIHESSAGTNPGWAGIKSDGSTTHNVGNIICAGYSTCYNRFRDYGSWAEGIEDWYKLISVEYVNGRGTYTVEQIIPIYAPSFENNVPGYIQAVNGLVAEWRAEGSP